MKELLPLPALEGRCDVRGLGKRLVSLHTLFYPSRFTLSSKYYVFFVCFFFFLVLSGTYIISYIIYLKKKQIEINLLAFFSSDFIGSVAWGKLLALCSATVISITCHPCPPACPQEQSN